MSHLFALSVGDPGSTTPSLAPINIGNLPSQVNNIVNSTNPLNSIIGLVINLMFFIVAFLAFVFFLWGGYRMIVSRGDKQSVEEARTMLVNSILGLSLAFIAFLAVNLIGHFFNVQLFQTTISIPQLK